MTAFLESLGRDLRYGIRGCWTARGFTAVALLSLALGIGATTAIFSVVYGVLIAPYPYARPGEIWAPQIQNAKNPQQGRGSYHLSEFLQVQKLDAFSDVMATGFDNILLGGDRPPENVTGTRLSGNAFQFLGVPPVIGRTILPSDIKPSGEAEPVVVLSYKAWQRWFDGDPGALGKTLQLNDQTYTVIGVMPPRFGWYGNDGVWLPLPTNTSQDRFVNAIMRLKPGVSQQAAEQQLHSLHVQLAQAHPADFPKEGFRTRLLNYLDITVASGEMQSSLRLLFGAVGFLLLIACANVANLQLARATARSREIAVRMSIGAGRFRVLRQLLTESVLLSFVGGALGVLFSIALTNAIVALMPEFYVPNEARITVNGYVLLFSVAVSAFTGILFGLAPAIQCSRADLVETLKEAGRSSSGSGGGKTRGVLVVAEVALSVVLLTGASLTVRGFVALHNVDVGFQPDRVLMVNLPLPAKRYPTYRQRVAFAQDVLQRVQSLPGVQSAAIGNGGLPFGGPQSAFTIDGRPPSGSDRVTVSLISADYSRTLGIPLRAGRNFTAQDVLHADRVALINQAAAKLWPAGASPIGERIRLDLLAKPPGANNLTPEGATGDVTVVGILGDTKNAGLRDPTEPVAYVPYTLIAPLVRQLAVRTQGAPMLLLNAVRQQVQAIDREQPVARPITLEEVLGFETVQPRFNMALFTFFGMLGLALAAFGIYSVLSYTVARRTHEIGIRMALGADRGDVLGLMLGVGGKLVLMGLGAGLLGSVLLGKFLRSEVFEVPATDPLAIVGVVALLSAAAALACYLPARRAARLSPMGALRHE